MLGGLGRHVVAGLICAALAVTGAAAQSSDPTPRNLPLGVDTSGVRSPVLVVESDLLFQGSAFGRRISAEVEAESAALAAQNRQIEADLTEEERALTEQRPTLEPEAFRQLADAFDEKVRSIRQEQDAKARALRRRQDVGRAAFLNAAAPVLESMMREAGAAVVLERRSVFLSLNAIDITRDAIARIDAEIGDGGDLVPAPEDLPPETTPPADE